MRRIASIVLLASFAASSSGLMRHLHLLEHAEHQRAHLAAAHSITSSGHPEPGHDEQNCATCATLNMPVLSAGYTPILVYLGLFVAFLSALVQRIQSQRRVLSIDCRGPPSH